MDSTFAIVHAATLYLKADGVPGPGRYTDVGARPHGATTTMAAQAERPWRR